MNTDYYDDLETRSHEQRQQSQIPALRKHLRQAREQSSYVAGQLAGIDIDALESRQDLAQIPVVRKSDLIGLQKAAPLFGGLTAFEPDSLCRVLASPGPIFEPQTNRSDQWRLARALHAAGFRKGMLVHNSFSYHLAPAGFMLESAIFALGGAVFPAGVGQTDMQVQAIDRLRPQAYAGTPSFLKILLKQGEEKGLDTSSLAVGMVSGEPLPPSLRAELEAFGIRVKQSYATADIGLIAYETDALEGMVIDEGVIVEIVQPGTGDPVPDGEVGEIVVTTFSPDYPLLRFGTGDMSAVMSGASPCGRTGPRIQGWMGRADQTTKVRGIFVHPAQIAAIAKSIAEVQRVRLVVSSQDDQDIMQMHCEVTEKSDALAQRIIDCTREVCRLRTEAVLVSPGELPRDGIVIEDVRTYD